MKKKMTTAAVTELRPYAREEFTSYLGMIIALGSWGIMFAGLFFAYAGVRLSAPSWPPPGVPRLPILLPMANTGVLLLSSFTAARALRSIRRAKRDQMKALLGITVFLGALFLGLQYLLWAGASSRGLHMDSGTYGSVFYALTLFHALHVAAGMLALLWLVVRGERYTAHDHRPVRMCTMFWHFVDIVWVLTFVSVFVL
jgi:heme/copper-type cytochrome/quinol oxidase subunit 3